MACVLMQDSLTRASSCAPSFLKGCANSHCCPETTSLCPLEGSVNCSTAAQVSRSTQLMCFTCRSTQLLVGHSPEVTPMLTELWGRWAVDNITQLPTTSTFHEVKKLLPCGKELRHAVGFVC